MIVLTSYLVLVLCVAVDSQRTREDRNHVGILDIRKSELRVLFESFLRLEEGLAVEILEEVGKWRSVTDPPIHEVFILSSAIGVSLLDTEETKIFFYLVPIS